MRESLKENTELDRAGILTALRLHELFIRSSYKISIDWYVPSSSLCTLTLP
jgi:hypothetical protein